MVAATGLEKKQSRRFAKGQEQFNEAWVVAPEPDGVWGLGPTFNEDRCVRCHINNGRSAALDDGAAVAGGALVRLSLPGKGPYGEPRPHPAYGTQLQNRGIEGRVPPEGQAYVEYDYSTVRFPDGHEVELRKPKLVFRDMVFGELGDDVLLSLRIAPHVVGLGLLESVPEADIVEHARRPSHPEISGRVNYVWDQENERTVMGRFGWKAGQPSLRQQTAVAFHQDIGATTYLYHEENCPPAQVRCRALPSAAKCGGQGGCTGHSYRPEVVPSRLTNISAYLRTLAVPRPRNPADRQVLAGKELFVTSQCAACHLPELRAGPKVDIHGAIGGLIRAYTDLLLHDMGPGLADGRPEFEAAGNEWRTAPLWGIGLLPKVNGKVSLLHDGRARNVEEAILWHGGEAAGSREAYINLSASERAALIAFVNSL